MVWKAPRKPGTATGVRAFKPKPIQSQACHYNTGTVARSAAKGAATGAGYGFLFSFGSGAGAARGAAKGAATGTVAGILKANNDHRSCLKNNK